MATLLYRGMSVNQGFKTSLLGKEDLMLVISLLTPRKLEE